MENPKIERIYSRRNWVSKPRKKLIKIGLILLTISLTITFAWQSTEPIVDSKCREIAISIASKFASQEVKEMADIYNYDDLSIIEMDDERNVKMIKINVGLVNQIMADVAIGVQEGLDQYEEENFDIRLGSFTGSKLLSGSGPKIKIRIQTDGNVQTELKSEFTSTGINQTLHRLYINVICTTIVYTPFSNTKETVESKILLAEAVIVGKIPDTYYDLDGLDQDTALQVLN